MKTKTKEERKANLIDYSQYDYNKVKPIDMFLFADGEKMNQITWDSIQPWWRRLLMIEIPMPKEFTVRGCRNYKTK